MEDEKTKSKSALATMNFPIPDAVLQKTIHYLHVHNDRDFQLLHEALRKTSGCSSVGQHVAVSYFLSLYAGSGHLLVADYQMNDHCICNCCPGDGLDKETF